MTRLRDRDKQVSGSCNGLVLYKLGQATEIACARCAAHSTTHWIAILNDDWTRVWCKACYLAMPPEQVRA